jgi:hypothetical protein
MRLRPRRPGYAIAIATSAVLVGSLVTAATPASSQQATTTFDLDHGNILKEVIYPKFQRVSRDEASGRAATLTVDHAMLIEIPWFDAIAPYRDKAVGIYSNIPRRPEAEHTLRNINIAVAYSAFTSLNNQLPEYKDRWIEMMQAAGLDPEDTKEDPTMPSGIGVMAAKNALAARMNDGSNRDGDMGGAKYNRHPFADYTGYRPVNSSYELRDPSRWQPSTDSTRNVYRDQEFATPQYGLVKPFTFTNPAQFRVSPPWMSNHRRNNGAYRRQADEVLNASANLDDREKTAAELFNDKVLTFGAVAGTPVVVAGQYNTEQMVDYITSSDVAFVDSTIVTWHYKRKYDSVRPFSAVQYLYRDKKLTAWGGPGEGTVNDITGKEWQPYLSGKYAADTPEYPSETAALCLSFAAQVRRVTGTDQANISYSAPKGSSLVEPGVTPAADITLRWGNWTDFARDCSESRVWAGQNFPAAIDAAAQYAPKIGEMSYQYVQRKVNGG